MSDALSLTGRSSDHPRKLSQPSLWSMWTKYSPTPPPRGYGAILTVAPSQPHHIFQFARERRRIAVTNRHIARTAPIWLTPCCASEG